MKKKLCEIGEIIAGGTPSTKINEYWNGKISWITPKDLSNYKGRFISKGERSITEEGLNNSSAVLMPKNSILFTSRAPIGYVAIAEKELCTNQGFKSFVCDEQKCYYKYMYYWFLNNVETIKSKANGSTFQEVSGTVMKNIEIELPDMKTQKNIGNILDMIDRKIELNNRINSNLHELLKVIYDDWFEKYNYPNLNQNKHINWKKDKLGNYLKVERGLSYKGKFLSEKGTPMVNLGNIMPNGVFRIEKNKYYTGDYKEKVTANVGDIVVANTDMTQNREVLGTPVIIPPIYEDKIIYSHHIYGLKNLKLPKLFVFYSLLKPKFRNLAGGSATGTTVLALPKEVIEDYEIVIPDEETLNSFTKLAEKIQKRRENIILENIKLEQLRDTLLPKLMNGEIDLDNIEI